MTHERMERRMDAAEERETKRARWLIRSDEPDPLDGDTLYWSNLDGWVSLDTADRFDSTIGDLPIGGAWEAQR